MSYLAGKTAIPFNLRDSSGKTHLLEAYQGSWLLMVFHRHLG
jgi:peroxiredoxin